MVSEHIKKICAEIKDNPGEDSIKKLNAVFPAANQFDNDYMLATLKPLVFDHLAPIYRFTLLKYNDLTQLEEFSLDLNDFLLQLSISLSFEAQYGQVKIYDETITHIAQFLAIQTPMVLTNFAIDTCARILKDVQLSKIFVEAFITTIKEKRPNVMNRIESIVNPQWNEVKSLLTVNNILEKKPKEKQKEKEKEKKSPYGYENFPAYTTKFPLGRPPQDAVKDSKDNSVAVTNENRSPNLPKSLTLGGSGNN